MNADTLLKALRADQLPSLRRAPFDAATLREAERIVEHVRSGGEAALRACAERFDGLDRGSSLVIEPSSLKHAAEALPIEDRRILERAAERIRRFAEAQRAALRDFELVSDVGGGDITMGQRVLPLSVVGCYAPGGRYPLPSSVLMTAVTARAAGVPNVIVASLRPTTATLAAAWVAGADMVLPVGGAHAVAAMAFGAVSPRCDAVVGPGNKWVTAAKHCVSAEVAIDMLAGPSEVVVLADDGADPRLIAADLLAQAEHDEDALAILVTEAGSLLEETRKELVVQLEDLPTAPTARAALARSFAVLTEGEAESVAVCNALAPEHLEIHVAPQRIDGIVASLRTYGSLFIGAGAAEVLGDYGLGPNHTLPTGGTARFAAGLSVYNLLRARTYIRNAEASLPVAARAELARLARMEGLEAHARAVAARINERRER
jgi:phosphoribosyl-ATP pyrophosphohydrolase/phosphoribosyl-AMP cyclohydrolase/histidinol dehydrogenase